MIKVIKEGIKNRIECDYCEALLAYNKEDIQKEEQYWGPCDYNIIKYIICPQCKNKIIMKEVKIKLVWRELDNEFSVN